MTTKTRLPGSVLALGAVLALVPLAALAEGGHMQGAGPGMDRGMGPAAFDFATLDADGDGKVTRDELAAHRAAELAALDADGDGFVTADEAAAHALARMQERMAERAQRWIGRFDTDGDGRVAVADLPAGGLGDRMFAAIDADGDGAVTEAEIAEARAAFAKMRGAEGRMRGHGSDGGHGRMRGHGGDGDHGGWMRGFD